MTELITTWQRFAEVTIKTNDLDPMYSVIAGLAKTKDKAWMGRFLMYFLLFYDAGGAALVADMATDQDFWEVVESNVQVKEVKRGTERRHFRGANGLKAVQKLRGMRGSAWSTLACMYPAPIFASTPVTYTMLYQHMATAYAGTQFGPYFIWKLYDIFNVCLDMPISLSFGEALRYMPDEPRKAADVIFKDFSVGLIKVNDYISQFDHPVRPGKCGLAEAETVLCMLKGAFLTRTHTVGDDIHEKWYQLKDAPELRELLPPLVNDAYYKLGVLE